MQQVTTLYQGKEQLAVFLHEQMIEDDERLLLQVFTSQNDEIFIRELLDVCHELLPLCTIIGATTDGEITNGRVVTHETVLSFTRFETCTLHSAFSEEYESQTRGEILANALVDEETRLLLVFSDGLTTNGELFLEGVNRTFPDLMVAGGLAGDYAKFEKTYVFDKEHILSQGAVGVSISGASLAFFNDYSFNWQKIGKPLMITKCEGNRVYEIEGQSAVDTYMHYLGKEVADLLPSIGIEFPLISERGGMDIARAVIAKHEDGSLSFAGNITEGERLYFGYGDLKKILEDSSRISKNIAQFQPEAIFVYSCMARRNFIGNAISQELEPLQEIAPASGFFTYGEFFHRSAKNELMNQTMTVIALREGKKDSQADLPKSEIGNFSYHSINALIHLLNITSQEMMEQQVFAKSYERFAKLFTHSGDGLVVLHTGRIVECNERTLSLFGYRKDEKDLFMQTPVEKLIVSVEKIERMMQKMIEENEDSLLFSVECNTKEGNHFWTEVMMTRVVSAQETFYYMVLRDISERKAMEEQLQKQHEQLYTKAYTDDLTGLPNRKSMMEKLEQEILLSGKEDSCLALLFIDLDKLKVINDSLGHIAGDKLIQLIAKRLKQVVGETGSLARLGGDEFLVLMKKTDQERIIAQVEKLLSITRETITFDKNHLYVSASIGIARFPNDAKDAYNLLRNADAAMYEAKEKGGNQYCFYSKELTQKAYDQIRIAREFRRGIKNREFIVYYQPQIEIGTGKVIGVEALIRWNHPKEGFSSPGQFLPAIEKANLLQRLDRWVMNQAMKDMVQWYEEGLNPGRLSINIRMSELESEEWEEKLLKTMKRIGFDPSWLEIEITETEIMKQPERVVSLIHKLHKHNITVAIDDFGTGYSSLAQLKYLPFDKLKIDKVFIDDLPENSDACVLFDMMMTLANNLGVPVLAEGMEKRVQIDYLNEVGCQYAQGYYYAKPMGAEGLREVLVKK